MNVIEVEDLRKRFGRLEAVRGVSFSVNEGEIFGFLGPNGAGKTTTISMLCTLLTPTGGKAVLCGHDTVFQRTEVRRCIGLVFQDPTLDEYLTAEQNLLFHAYAYNVPRAIRGRRIDEVLDLVELSSRRKSRVRVFSGGMKRRLEIARGLLHNPRVLFLDEPTLGLDPQTRHHIWEYILNLRKQQGLTIFLTTHYMDEAEYCDRIAVIDYGKIVALDTPDRLKDSLGGDMVTLKAEDAGAASAELQDRFSVSPQVQNGLISFTIPHGETFLAELAHGFNSRLTSISVRRPTLEDIFLKLTGHAIRDQEAGALDELRDVVKTRRGR